MSKHGNALLAMLALCGCGIFDFGEDEDDTESYCYDSVPIAEQEEVLLSDVSQRAIWDLSVTFTGVDEPKTDLSRELKLGLEKVAASSSSETSQGQLRVTFGPAGAPWLDQRLELDVGGPRESDALRYDASRDIEQTCAGQDSCELELELTIESHTSAVVSLREVDAAIIISGIDTGIETCGIADLSAQRRE